jgi:hypothetical protein
MPKNEWDAEDPYELTGVVLWTAEDTSLAMAETFVEEFLRLGYGARQVLALFRNPFYRGPYGVWRRHGDEFVKDLITRVFLQWGRCPEWSAGGRGAGAEGMERDRRENHQATVGDRPVGESKRDGDPAGRTDV